MPINAPNPMEAFTMGQARGRANSPITGIGLAIQNIVDDARKKGLLKAQSKFQTEGASQNAIAKETRAAARGEESTSTPFVKPSGKVVEIPHKRSQTPKAFPQQDQSAALIEAIFGGEDPGEADPDVVTIQFNDGTTQDMPRAEAVAAGYIK